MRSTLGINTHGREEQEAGRVGGKGSCGAGPRTASVDPAGCSGDRGPFRVVPSRAERARPLFSLTDQSWMWPARQRCELG